MEALMEFFFTDSLPINILIGAAMVFFVFMTGVVIRAIILNRLANKWMVAGQARRIELGPVPGPRYRTLQHRSYIEIEKREWSWPKHHHWERGKKPFEPEARWTHCMAVNSNDPREAAAYVKGIASPPVPRTKVLVEFDDKGDPIPK